MKFPIFQASILSVFALMVNSAPSNEIRAKLAPPTPNTGSQTAQPFAIDSATGIGKGVVLGNFTSSATKEPLLSSRSDTLDKRQTEYYVCVTGLAPALSDCNVIISELSVFESITLSAGYCYEWAYSSCVAFVCSTPCGGITFTTNWAASQLEVVEEYCLDYAHNGELYTATTPYFEVGFGYYGNQLTIESACT